MLTRGNHQEVWSGWDFVPTDTQTLLERLTESPFEALVAILVLGTLAAALALFVAIPTAQAAFSGGDGKIAFTSDADGDQDIWTMNSDGTFPLKLINDSLVPHADFDPAWSPDGHQIAYVSDRDGDYEIYRIDPSGGGRVQLTNNTAWDSDPAWSPDGTQIVFASSRDGNFEIYKMNASDGSGQTRLTNLPSHQGFPAWSPDGLKIAYESDQDSQNEIYLMNPDGSGQQNFTQTPAPFAESQPNWSPDSARIVMGSNNAVGDGFPGICVWRVADRIVNCEEGYDNSGVEGQYSDRFPAFSPTGQAVLISRARITVGATRDIWKWFSPNTSFTQVNPSDTAVDDHPDQQPLIGQLIVKKDAVPNDTQNFTFTAGGGISPSSFQLDDDAGVAGGDNTLSDTRTFPRVPPGTYSITETVPSGWSKSSATCSDGSSPSSINVSVDEIVTCTFRNVKLYEHPVGATPMRTPLVPAFQSCTSGNSAHGAPLNFPSCYPAVPSSGTIRAGGGSIGFASVLVCNTGAASALCHESAPGFTTAMQPDVRLSSSIRDVQCRLTGTPSGCTAGSDYNPNGATGPYTTACIGAASCGAGGRFGPFCAPGGSLSACVAGTDVTLTYGLGQPGPSVDPTLICGGSPTCPALGHGLRETDLYNCDPGLPPGDPSACPATSNSAIRPGTVVDIQFPVPLDCIANPPGETAAGSTCGANTTANAIVPGAVLSGRQAVVELGEIQLLDSGADGTRGNADDQRFAVQGIYLP